MTLISCCLLKNYIITFKWAFFVRILADVHTFYYEANTTSVYNCLQASTTVYKLPQASSRVFKPNFHKKYKNT